MTKDGYKEINIKRPSFQDEETIDIILEDDSTDDNEDQSSVAPIEGETVKQQPKKPSRSQARIRQLSRNNNELADKIAKLERDLEAAKTSGTANNKATKESLKERLNESIQLLNKQLADAIRNGEAEQVVELQEKLMDSRMQLRDISKEVLVEEPVTKQVKPKNEVPEEAMFWIDQHPEFNTDEEFRMTAIGINNKMVREGHDPEDVEFYEELDKRLAKRFPELFGVDEKTQVSLDDNDSSYDTDSGKEPLDVKPKKVSMKKEQVVSGSSRPASQSVIPSKKSNSVTLSSADIAQAERWGLSLEQMARRMKHLDSNKKDGYAPINMGK